MQLSNYTQGTYGKKDEVKFLSCTKLISRGAVGSSSARYGQHPLANTGNYVKEDVVGISVNGNRRNRLPVDQDELALAIKAKCEFITDTLYHRSRSFNVGEREVAITLQEAGYNEYEPGRWRV